MDETKVSDVVVPELFLPYMIQRTAELSEFITAGIVESSPQFDDIATNAGGKFADMPFWNDLDGDDETVEDDTDATVGKITSSKDVARMHVRQKAFGAHDLAGILAGDDPMAAIAELLAGYRARRIQAHVIATLNGIFGAASMAGNVLDIHKASGTPDSTNYLNGLSFITATQLMGDSKAKLTAVLMHSAVESHLRKLDLIDYVPDSEGKAMIGVFQGKRVIVDDGCPVETIDGKPVYSTFLFGTGAIAYGQSRKNEVPEGAAPGSTWQLEFGRNSLGSSSHLINRWRIIMHPRGIKWAEASVAKNNPTNAEIAIATNWVRVFEQKNVRIVKVRHNVLA